LRIRWLLKNGGSTLSAVPRGDVQLTGVPVRFDIRGIIQLTSRNMKSPFPARAPNVLVGRKGRFLHFLEGAVQGEPFSRKPSEDARGTAIGRYEVRYQDGRSLQIPIRYGQDVLVYTDPRDDLNLPEAKVAWQSTNGTTSVSLYHQRWPNPRPDTTIASLDFVSNMAKAAPFLIAISLEP